MASRALGESVSATPGENGEKPMRVDQGLAARRAFLRVPPIDNLAVLRSAYRALAGKYPAPFTYAYWSLRNGDLYWTSEGPQGLRTDRGLAPYNEDLPSNFHVVANRRHPLAVRAYRLIELAHAVRWCRYGVRRNSLRGVPRLVPADTDDVANFMLEAVAAYSALAMEWKQFQSEQRADDYRRALRIDAFREVARLNEDRARSAKVWRDRALVHASERLRADPDCSVYALSICVADRLAVEFAESAPSQNTVYQFLRSALETSDLKSGISPDQEL